jgi:hypothetical protein
MLSSVETQSARSFGSDYQTRNLLTASALFRYRLLQVLILAYVLANNHATALLTQDESGLM